MKASITVGIDLIRIILILLVFLAGVGVMGSMMAPMANTITAPITLDPSCEWDFGTYGLEVVERVKRTIQSEYDCYKYCDEDQFCEWFSFRDAKWAKRKMCVLYYVDYKFRGDSDKWMSGPACTDIGNSS